MNPDVGKSFLDLYSHRRENEPTEHGWLNKSYFTFSNKKLMDFQSRLICSFYIIYCSKVEKWNDSGVLKAHRSV